MVYHRLDKRLLYMFRVTDTDFFASAFGMQSDRFVGEDRKLPSEILLPNEAITAFEAWAAKEDKIEY